MQRENNSWTILKKINLTVFCQYNIKDKQKHLSMSNPDKPYLQKTLSEQHFKTNPLMK